MFFSFFSIQILEAQPNALWKMMWEKIKNADKIALSRGKNVCPLWKSLWSLWKSEPACRQETASSNCTKMNIRFPLHARADAPIRARAKNTKICQKHRLDRPTKGMIEHA